MNDIAALCERVGADVDLVRKGMGSDTRIGYPFLFPGVGYGGCCFPKDVKALIPTAREHGLEFDMLRAAERINERQKKALVHKAVKHFGGPDRQDLRGLGPGVQAATDDMREAPAIEVIEGLLGKGAKVQAHDPVAMATWRADLRRPRQASARRMYEALEGADALCVVTEWNEFRHPDFDRMKQLMKTPVVFDGRNIYDPRPCASAASPTSRLAGSSRLHHRLTLQVIHQHREVLHQPVQARCAQRPTQLGLERAQHARAVLERRPALARDEDELGSTVEWIRRALHQAHALQVFDELARGLLGDAHALGQLGEPHALLAEPGQHLGVRRAEADVGLGLDARDGLLVHQPRGAKQQRTQLAQHRFGT